MIIHDKAELSKV